jgi:hypothetical protein
MKDGRTIAVVWPTAAEYPRVRIASKIFHNGHEWDEDADGMALAVEIEPFASSIRLLAGKLFRGVRYMAEYEWAPSHGSGLAEFAGPGRSDSGR